MPVEKLTAADVAQRFQDGYTEVARHLHDYELCKARFLCIVGHDCLQVVRGVLEPFPDHDLTGRKAARSKAIKEIEELLPELDGIGAPQVNRWIRWAGIAEVLGGETTGALEAVKGLKQAHLMVLEKFIDQHEPSAGFRLKDPWKAKLEEVTECVAGTIETGASARELEEAIDAEAEFPKAPETKETPCPIRPTPDSASLSNPSCSATEATAPPVTTSPTDSNGSTTASTSGAQPSSPAVQPL